MIKEWHPTLFFGLVRAGRVDDRMRLCTVTGPILSDARPTGSHFPSQDPVRHLANFECSFGSSRYTRSASLRIGPQLPAAVGPTGLDEARRRVRVIDVEQHRLVHREPPVQVGHGAFKRPRALPAAWRPRFHSFCRV